MAPRSPSAVVVMLLAVALAVAYALRVAAIEEFAGVHGLVACKAGSIVLLAVLCFRSRALGSPLLGTGMLIHSVGDVLIARSSLLLAMAFFLCGHLVYSYTFWRRRRRWSELSAGSRVLAVGFLGYGVLLVSLLAPGVEGVYLVAIPVYSCALLGMAVSSVFYGPSHSFENPGSLQSAWQIPSAAALYVFSDSVIGYAEFIGLGESILWLQHLTWPTYFIAQFLFCVAVSRQKSG